MFDQDAKRNHCFNAELIAVQPMFAKGTTSSCANIARNAVFVGHIRLMDQATQSGAIIMPPVPGLYTAANGRRHH